MPARQPHHRVRFVAAALLVAALVAACGSSGSDASTTTASTAAVASSTTVAATSTTTAPHPLRILVTNDDGVTAPGIDAVVNGLKALPDTTVTVVAPFSNQSGTGGRTTPGALKIVDAKTASGVPAKAVVGFPADTIRAALDDLHVTADLVVSGINIGQNLGPSVDASGTVGAARAGAARGIPALAASQGLGKKGFDFPSGTKYVLDWVKQHRAAILAGTAPKVVANLNIPSCQSGTIRGILEEPAPPLPLNGALTFQDCTATGSGYKTDVLAFNAGYVTLSEPLRPKA